MNKNILCSWSGGKDSCFALMQTILQGYSPQILLNVMNEEGKISRSHGIPKQILEAQAAAMQLPIYLINSSWNEYEKQFTNALIVLQKEYQLNYAVFGDIDLQAHRDWEEKVCHNASLQAILPLWQQNRKALVIKMIDAGIETMIVSCNTTMGKHFLGKIITKDLIVALENIGVDVCGENGEFHTLVLDCPLFSNKINVVVENKLQHDNYWFCSLKLVILN